MGIYRFNCVHCGAPLKTSAELTPEKRILCPKCESIFPVPSHLLSSSPAASGTVAGGPDITSGVGGESPRVKLLDMEGILDSGSAAPQAQKSPQPAAAAETPRSAESPEPWEEELRQAASSPAEQADQPTGTRPEEEDLLAAISEGGPASQQKTPPAAEPGEIFSEEAGSAEEAEQAREEPFVTEPVPEEVTFGQEEPPKKSRLWLWIILLVVVVVIGGLVAAWFLGWLDPVLELIGLKQPSTAQASRPTNEAVPSRAARDSRPQTPSKPLPGGSGLPTPQIPGITPPVPIGQNLALLEKIFTDAPAQPLAAMHCWQYVPSDANFIVCVNLGELTQNPTFRQLFSNASKNAGQFGPRGATQGPVVPEQENSAEILVTDRVDWNELASSPNSAFFRQFVILVRYHSPPDQNKFLETLKSQGKDFQQVQAGNRTIYLVQHQAEGQPVTVFYTWLASDILVVGKSGRENFVPGLVKPADQPIDKRWQLLAQRAGVAHLAVFLLDLHLDPVLGTLQPPDDTLKRLLSHLGKTRGAVASLELQPKDLALRIQLVPEASHLSKEFVNCLQESYQKHIQPNLDQLAAFAPELVADFRKNLQLTSDESGVVSIGVRLGYQGIANAIQAVMKSLQLKPVPLPSKP